MKTSSANLLFLILTFLWSITNCLPYASAQNCGFVYSNGTDVEVNDNGIAIFNSEINELVSVTSLIWALSAKSDEGVITCNALPEDYFSIRTNNTDFEIYLVKEIDQPYDEGEIDQMSISCTLKCGVNPITVVNFIQITPVNDQSPLFNIPILSEIIIPEIVSPGVDILAWSNELVYAYDNDFDPRGLDSWIEFRTDNPKFVTLPSHQISYTDGVERIYFLPRLGLASPWADDHELGSVSFNLIAENKGEINLSTSIPITVTFQPFDLRNPEFDYDYYTTKIDSPQDQNVILQVEPDAIRAVDGDTEIDDIILYKIIDNGSLNIELVPKSDGGVDVRLLSTTDASSADRMTYVVIEAKQQSNDKRSSKVVLAVELPSPALTSTSEAATSSSTTSPQPSTCPTLIDDITSSTTTSPISTVTFSETCPPCSTSTATDCEFYSQTSEPTLSTVYTTLDGNSTATTVYVSTDSPTVTCPVVTCPAPVTCPDVTCPDVTCPDVTCPDVTCPDVTCPATISTCPEPTSCSCAEYTSTLPSDSITTTQSPTGSSVNFQKDQYASEIVENSPIGTPVTTVNAITDSASSLRYNLQSDEDSAYFTIDGETGFVTTGTVLQKGLYTFRVEASVADGGKDVTTVRVQVIEGYNSGEMQFGSALYHFDIPEKSPPETLIGTIELRNVIDNFTPTIKAVEPIQMQGYFYLKTSQTAQTKYSDLLVNKTFNRAESTSQVTITISASNPANRLNEISTVVSIKVLDVNEAPSFNWPEKSLLIGYPARTFFDSSVPMPIFTFKASDPDEGKLATFTYHLIQDGLSNPDFDIDSQTGCLFTKNIDKLPSNDRKLVVTVRDLNLLESKLNITVKSIGADAVHVMTAIGSETLSTDAIADDLSSVLPYRVVVLHKSKSPSTLRADQFLHAVTVYAIESESFVGRAQFVKDLGALNMSHFDWEVDVSSVRDAEPYDPDRIAQNAEAYMIATAILATFLGLLILGAIAYLVYLMKRERMPWKRIFEHHSKTVIGKEKYLDSENTYARASDSTTDSHTDPIQAETEKSSVESRTQMVMFKPETVKEKPQPTANVTADEEEVYCPPTPTPKKSILKEVTQEKHESEKGLERGGVSFDPTPDIIEVAATLSTAETNEELKRVSPLESDSDDEDLTIL